MHEMTDLHTHILPHMDDGAHTTQQSLAMLKEEYAQGVRRVVLTPHFYIYRESPEQFLQRRQAAWERLADAVAALPEQERSRLPEMLLGAEVAWHPMLLEVDLAKFCIGSTSNLLLELPVNRWEQNLVNQIYDLQMHQRILPIFAHFDRYLQQKNKSIVEQLLQMGLPVQLGTEPFLNLFFRQKVLSLIRSGHGHILASDCHNMDTRKPNLLPAMRVVEKHLGGHVAENLCRTAKELTQTT